MKRIPSIARSVLILSICTHSILANATDAPPNIIANAGTPESAQVETEGWVTQVTRQSGVMPLAVSVVNQNSCWIAGAQGKIIRTTNGGNSWDLINSGSIGMQTIYAFEAVDESVAFAGVTALENITSLHRTTNAGLSWNLVYSQASGFIRSIKMFTGMKGIAVGDPVGGRWTVLKTTNGGERWHRVASEPPVIGGAISSHGFGAFDSCYMWFFDNVGHLFLSADCGETWSYSNFPPGSKLFWMNSPNIRVAIGSSNEIYRTTDGGTTWNVFATFLPYLTPTGLVGASWTRDFWFVVSGIHFSSNAGATWSLLPPHGLNARANLIDMVTSGSTVSAWATGYGDTVYHYVRIATSIQERQQLLGESFALSQNYPNPFNPTTKIKFQIPNHKSQAHVTLKVHDLLGREVATLVDEEMAPGSYERVFNAEGLASGVYMYRLTAGSYSQTRKLILSR